MKALDLKEMENVKGGEWPSGSLCFFAPAGWLSSRGKITSAIWDVVARECWKT